MTVLDAPAAPAVPEAPTLATDWDEALRGLMEVHEDPPDRVLVQVYMPWVTDYNPDFDPLRCLVYGPPPEPIGVGDLVLCPPSPKHRAPFKGIVVSLDASGHPYKGPVKSLIRKVSS